MELTQEYFDEEMKKLNQRLNTLATQESVDALARMLEPHLSRLETLESRMDRIYKALNLTNS